MLRREYVFSFSSQPCTVDSLEELERESASRAIGRQSVCAGTSGKHADQTPCGSTAALGRRKQLSLVVLVKYEFIVQAC